MRCTKGIVAIGRSAAAAPWTPAELDGVTGLRWYDFTDTATISDTAGAIDSITDKYAGGYTLTGSGATRPTTGTATLDSLNVGAFAADYLTAASAADWKFLHDGTSHVVSMVVKCGLVADPNAVYGLFGTNGSSSDNFGAAAFFDDRASFPRSETLVYMVTRDVSLSFCVNQVSPSRYVRPNEWLIVTILSDPDNGTAANRSSMFVDRGRALESNTASAAVSAANPTYVFQLGTVGNNAIALTGQIAEVVMSSSHADRWLIEDYFYRKFPSLRTPYAVQSFDPQVVVVA